MPYAAPAATMSSRDRALRAGLDRDVEEPRPRDIDVRNAFGAWSRSAISVGQSRGVVPAFFASCSATFVA